MLNKLKERKLVKEVKGVKGPEKNRRHYLLYHLEPSVELTGGVWYDIDGTYKKVRHRRHIQGCGTT